MFQSIAHALHLRPYGMGSVLVLLLYTVTSELRFGRRARSHTAGAEDRGSTWAVSLASAVPLLGFVFVVKLQAAASPSPFLVRMFAPDSLPWLPATAWAGVVAGALGLLVRLWAVLTLRDRYTRTLLIHDDHHIERSGPYRFVRHPGYLGSLLCLNGIAAGSGSATVALASLVATIAAYVYRVRVEDAMLVGRFGAAYEAYRREVYALWPFWRKGHPGPLKGVIP